MEKKNILLSQQSSTSPERTKINILFDSSSRFRSWRLLNASSSSLPPSLPNSSAILLSLAFSFAPNLRPIIAAEEAISNLNETPSRSVPPSSPRLASPRDRQDTPPSSFVFACGTPAELLLPRRSYAYTQLSSPD